MMTAPTVTAAEVAQAMGITTRAVQKRAKKENWPFQALNGRDRAFDRKHLPADVLAALSAGELPAVKTPSHLSLYNRIDVGSPDLTDWQNRIALARVDLVREYANVKAAAKRTGKSVCAAAEFFLLGYNTGQLLPQVFERVGKVSRSNIENYVKIWREAGGDFAALAPAWGNRKGQRKTTAEEQNAALSFALHPNRLRIAEAVRLAKMMLDKRGVESPSSEATLRRWLLDFKDEHYDQWVFARRGEKALNDLVLPYLKRDRSLLDVGDVLVADGHVLNFRVINPETGKACRATLVGWLDWASAYPVGWEIMPTENVQCVAAALRRAILTLGKMPTVAYLDNGKAFKAKYFTSKADFDEAGFYGMFARCGIETIFAMPYNAQAKPIERFFGTFGELERMMPTCVGSDIEHKPAYLLRNEKLHKKLHEKLYGDWVPTIEQTNEIIRGWVDVYAARPSKGLRGLCPQDVLDAGRGPGVDPVALRHLMMAIKITSPGRNGVKVLGRDYYDAALYGYRKPLMVRYDIQDPSSVEIYTADGSRHICTAEPLAQVHPVARILGTPDDVARMKHQLKEKGSRKKETVQWARDFIENTPTLVPVPENAEASTAAPKTRPMLGREEAERIEREVATAPSRVVALPSTKPRYESDAEHYEIALERECRGEDLALEEMAFMRAFEKTQAYGELQERFDFLREYYLSEEGNDAERVRTN